MTRCPACHSTRVRQAYRGDLAHFLRCRDCASVFDTDPPTPAELRAQYEGKEYYSKTGAAEGNEFSWGYADDYLADRALITAKFDRLLEHLERYVKPGRLLDVGAGPGFLVDAAQRRGWSAVGLDLNSWAAEYARRELGVDVRAGDLSDEPFAGEEFDAITMMDVIEHVTDPDELLGQAAKLVRPEGAVALLTPDAASPISRLLGRRWPEVRRPGEHTVLFSIKGLSAALARHGFLASSWHTIGKEAPVATLVADVSTLAPGLTSRVHDAIADRALGRKQVDLDPRTKFVLYARKLPARAPIPAHAPPRVPKSPAKIADVEEAILDELGDLARAPQLLDWMFASFAALVPGAHVLEVGAGIGTFTKMMLDHGAASVLAIEPEASCAAVLDASFSADERVQVSRDALPDAPVLAGREHTFDLVVCQNVLEHIADDLGALEAMGAALRPGGHLALLVPAGPRLFGALDDAYGHWRRYRPADVRELVTKAGLRVDDLRYQNLLGVVGWWAKNRRPGARIGSTSLRIYETLVTAWRPLEERVRPNAGLSLVCVAHAPA